MIEMPEKIKFKKGKLLSAKVYQEFFPIKLSETVLNVGCGDGVQAIIYKGNHKKMIGVDINVERLETAKKLMELYGIDNFETISANVENIPLSEKFDKTLAVDIIEHVANPGNLVLEINRLLKEGGELLITFPLMHDKWTALFRFVGRKILRRKGKTIQKEGWDPDAHQRKRGAQEWIEIIERAGFKLIDSRATTMFPPLHYLGMPKFWYSVNFIYKIDGFFCKLPVIKNYGSTLMCVFKKI